MPASSPDLVVTVSSEPSRTVVCLAGELDLSSAPGLEAALAPTLAGPVEDRVVVDLSELTFADVAGLTALLSTQRVLAQRGTVLELRSPRPIVRRIVDLLGLQDRLPVAGQNSVGTELSSPRSSS